MLLIALGESVLAIGVGPLLNIVIAVGLIIGLCAGIVIGWWTA